MGIFDSRFGQSVSLPKDRWGKVALAISVAFEGLRRELYDVAAEMLSKAFYESRPLRGRVYSDQAQGLNLKAFQLYLASYLIAKRRYIKPGDGKQFADLLWAQVLGNQILEGVECAKDLQPESGAFPRIYKFFCLLASHIAGKPNPAEGMLLMDSLGEGFVSQCLLAVAQAFGDPAAQEVAREEGASVQEAIKELKERFFRQLEKRQHG